MSSTLSNPMLTATSNDFLDFQSKLRRVLLSKGLWHICDPSAEILTRPKIQVEKGANQVPGYIIMGEDLANPSAKLLLLRHPPNTASS